MGYLGLLEAILGNLGAGRRENAIGVARIGAETLKIATVSRFLWFLAPPLAPKTLILTTVSHFLQFYHRK